MPALFHIGLKAATSAVVPAATETTALRATLGTAEKARKFAVEIAPLLVEIWRPLIGAFAGRPRRLGGLAIIGTRLGFSVFRRGLVFIPAPSRIVQIEHAPGAPAKPPWKGHKHLEHGIQFHGIKLFFFKHRYCA